MTSTGKASSILLLFLLLFGGTVTQAQDGTSAVNSMDTGTLIVVVTGIVAISMSAFVVWRSLQDPLLGMGEKADIKKRQTQELRVAPRDKKVPTETIPPMGAGGGGGAGDSQADDDDASVLILILLESPSNWLKAPYQWEVMAEDTPFYIGSTLNRTSSMDLDIGIPDGRVSGNHIRIDYNEDIGRFTFTDMNSFNGSEWDSDVMAPDRPYMLQADYKKMLVVSHYYKFMVNTMSRGELDELVYGDGTPFPMFLDDPEITDVLGSADDGASPTEFAPDYYEEMVSNPVINVMPAVTQSIPRDVTQQVSNFDFDEIRYRSSANVGKRDLVADVLPDPTPLPKNVDAYLIWHESEREDTKLTNTVLTIGSSENADITLKSEEVSDTHLILMWRNGEFLLMDVSREGTWLQKGRRQERRRMPTNQPEQLQPGVQYMLDVARNTGNFTFEYKEVLDASEDPIEIPSLPEGVTPYLHIVREEMNDHRREVKQLGNNITLGRYVDSKVLLVTETVSRSHAQIVWRDDGFVIRDVNSRGGTKVNDTLLIENDNLWISLEANEIHRIVLSPGEKEVLVEFCYYDKRE